MWIGVISDTHGTLSHSVLDVFDGVDYILHCGNIGSPEVLEELSQIAPVAGVLGQGDDSDLYPFQKTMLRKWFDVGIYLSHRIGDPTHLSKAIKEELNRLDPQVILFGYIQGAFNNRVEDRLFFNPGPAGRKRSRHQRSVGILEIEGRLVRGEVVALETS